MPTSAGEIKASFKADTGEYNSKLKELLAVQKSSVKVMQGQLDDFVTANEKSLNEIIDANGNLIVSYKELSKEQKTLVKEYERNLKNLTTASNRADVTTRKLNKSFQDAQRANLRLVKSNENLSKSSQLVSKSNTNMIRSFGMTSVQVSQLTGQIQGGTNAMLALSQQAADIGFAFGPLGVAIGAAVSLLAGLGLALQSLNQDAEENKETIKELAESYNNLGEAGQAQVIVKLESIRTKALNESAKASEALSIEQEKLDERIKSLKATLGDSAVSYIDADDKVIKLRENVGRLASEEEKAETRVNAVNQAISNLGKSTDETGSSTQLASEKYADMTIALSENAREIAKRNYLLGEGLEASSEEIEITLKAIDTYFDEKEKLEAATKAQREKTQADKEAARAQEQLNKSADRAIESLDKQAELINASTIQDPTEQLKERQRIEKEGYEKRHKDAENYETLLTSLSKKHEAERAALKVKLNKEAQDEVFREQKENFERLKSSMGESLDSGLDFGGLASVWGVEQLDSDFGAYMERLREQLEQKRVTQEQYDQLSLFAEQEYSDKRIDLNKQTAMAIQSTLSSVGSAWLNYAASMAGATEEEKKALKQRFLQQQAMALAQVNINYLAELAAIWYSDRETFGTFAEFTALPKVEAATARYAVTSAGIAGVSIAGAFHGGTDAVPQAMDNQSFLLKAGERVVQPKANRDLTNYLAEQKGSGSGSVTINAPVNIQRVNNDQEIISAISKFPQTIAALNQKGNQQRPTQRRR